MQLQRVCHDTLPWLISVSLDDKTPHPNETFLEGGEHSSYRVLCLVRLLGCGAGALARPWLHSKRRPGWSGLSPDRLFLPRGRPSVWHLQFPHISACLPPGTSVR